MIERRTYASATSGANPVLVRRNTLTRACCTRSLSTWSPRLSAIDGPLWSAVTVLTNGGPVRLWATATRLLATATRLLATATRYEGGPQPSREGDHSSSRAFVVTTITGQVEWCSTAWLVEPSSRPANPPRPRDPTTMRSTALENSVSSWAPVPSSTWRRTCRSG